MKGALERRAVGLGRLGVYLFFRTKDWRREVLCVCVGGGVSNEDGSSFLLTKIDGSLHLLRSVFLFCCASRVGWLAWQHFLRRCAGRNGSDRNVWLTGVSF